MRMRSPDGGWFAATLAFGLVHAAVVAMEATVVAIEAVALRCVLGWPRGRAFNVALIANAMSFGTSLVLTRLL